MDLKKLREQMPYQWRVQSFSRYSPKAMCVAYVDARDVQDKLDEVVGPENWADDYKLVDGKLFAGIGIRVGEDQWVWKWDTGNESNIEKDKGQVSDSFKRAAVKWGVGRFLYDLETMTVNANKANTGNNRPFVVNKDGERVYNLTEYINHIIDYKQKNGR